MKKFFCAALLALVTQFAHAIDTAPAFADAPRQERYEHLIRQLRCLQCRSETIADSNAALASDLRRQVRESIAAGRTDEEILKFMSDRYGDYVLYTPPVKPETWLLWGTPVLLILIGGAWAGVVIVRRSRLPDNESPEITSDEIEKGAS